MGPINNQKIEEKFTSLEVNLNVLRNTLEDRLNDQQTRIDDVAENDIKSILIIKSSIPVISIQNEKQNNYNQILNNKPIKNLLGIK